MRLARGGFAGPPRRLTTPSARFFTKGGYSVLVRRTAQCEERGISTGFCLWVWNESDSIKGYDPHIFWLALKERMERLSPSNATLRAGYFTQQITTWSCMYLAFGELHICNVKKSRKSAIVERIEGFNLLQDEIFLVSQRKYCAHT